MQGLPELREAIAKHISIKKNYNYSAESILIGPGTKELMFLLNILIDGDVLLPIPSWVSYEPQGILGRNKNQWLQTSREKNSFATADEIVRIVYTNKDKNYILIIMHLYLIVVIILMNHS